MRDIPIFTGCSGIASLILSPIPYWGKGYVLIRSVFTNLSEFIRECESFCRLAGAKEVFFSGEADFSHFDVYTTVVEREAQRSSLPETTAYAVATNNADRWIDCYNEKFRNVPAAQHCKRAQNAYDILRDGRLIGIGQVMQDQILTVAALERGAGADCLCALAKLCVGETIRLNCSEENLTAMRLYDRLGFSEGRIKEIWYYKKPLAI